MDKLKSIIKDKKYDVKFIYLNPKDKGTIKSIKGITIKYDESVPQRMLYISSGELDFDKIWEDDL